MKLEPYACPMCHKLNTMATGEDGRQPDPGDYSVCWGCNMVGIFYEVRPGVLSVRPTTGPEAATFAAQYPHVVSTAVGGDNFDEILSVVKKMLRRPENN